MDEIASLIRLISRTIPEEISIDIKEDSIMIRHRFYSELYVQKYFLPELDQKSFLESLLDEIQTACADMLSQYWPKIQDCHLIYEVRSKEGRNEILFVIPDT